ncbi:TPA: DNA phosphorothioation-dependent restriction protein DptG [Clostridioides difficile]|nr:DNA phosphorothioation-dependent restriction protein DptG [Clostridioides difficile]HCQ6371074.1 DNA phosphorothioation-dependent restriction protein DptG [Clostridioides difficile]
MQYIINEENFKQKYRINEGIARHNSVKNIVILPYTTKYKDKSKLKENIEKFEYCVGEFCRLIYNKKMGTEEKRLKDVDLFIKYISVNSSNDSVALKSIIKELFFNEKENIYIFHPKLLNYIYMPHNGYYKKLSRFLYDVLLNNSDNVDIKSKINKCFEYEPNNIMELIILNNLPKLEDEDTSKSIYKCICRNVSKLFKEDLEFMLNYPELITNEFERLLKYYYFFYVSQLSIKLSYFFDGDKDRTEKVYFILNWEKASKSRISYNMGWKMLESHIKRLFSHVHTLEILNTNDNTNQYDYIDLNKIINDLSYIERTKLYKNIEYIKNIYINSINDIQWKDYDEKTQRYKDDNLKKEIYDLYRRIDYQFNKSSRRYSNYRKYKDWFEEYCKLNFLKKAGPLGNILKINQEELLFITKLCIKDKSKIKLKELFEEYEKRGIYFDRDSQCKVVELFEKLNIIEKKSDSGDAQYVRSIL